MDDAVWMRVEVEVPPPLVGRLEAFLETLGALAITLSDAGDEPLLEPAPGQVPLWSNVIISGLFPAQPDPRAVIEASIEVWYLGNSVTPRPLNFVPVMDDDWAAAWRQHAVRLDFPGVLHLRPDDDEPVPADGGALVRLTPGLAFGTGGHATTQGCLAALAERPPAGLDVLDFGCGSGVLAIAALALGARRAVAVDHDPQALAATCTNAARNGVSDRLVSRTTLAEGEGYDLLLANLLADSLIALAHQLQQCVRRGGRALLSGILPEQADSVRRAWSDFSFEIRREDGWVVLAGERHP